MCMINSTNAKCQVCWTVPVQLQYIACLCAGHSGNNTFTDLHVYMPKLSFRLNDFSDKYISIGLISFQMLEMHQYGGEDLILHLC